MKREYQNASFEEVQQIIENLKVQIEEAKRIDEACKIQLEEKQFLEAEVVAQRNEAKKRENILTSHLKERFEDLKKIEAEFNQQERRLEEEIVSLKTQLCNNPS
jgi:chromosome segregation ATPase